MAKYNVSLQSYLIIVGLRLESIQASYINVDKTLYKVVAVDFCYKIFQVLNAKYPPESEEVWLLWQQNLYNYESQQDNKIKGVIRLGQKMKKMVWCDKSDCLSKLFFLNEEHFFFNLKIYVLRKKFVICSFLRRVSIVT